MSQFDYINELAKYGLENNREQLLSVLTEAIEYARKTNKNNVAVQLQTTLRDALRGSPNESSYFARPVAVPPRQNDEADDYLLERLNSKYGLSDIVLDAKTKEELTYFLQEHHSSQLVKKFELPLSNKLLLHGPPGCGKTLASYVIAGELRRTLVVINLGAIVSSKLGETSRNLSKIFKRAATKNAVLLMDEFDSLGKIRDYDQDHGEMKRVVNTLLQLFDYLPESTILIAATNQKEMIDEALLRRFDASIEFKRPRLNQIKQVVNNVLCDLPFGLDKPRMLPKLCNQCLGLSYYSVQRTLITAIKRSLLVAPYDEAESKLKISTTIWSRLLLDERRLTRQH